MDTLREFFTSSSGLAPARQGLGLGWVISALSAIAVLLGGKEAGADCSDESTTCGYFAECAERYPDKPDRKCTTRWNNKCEKYYDVCDCIEACP